MVVEEVVEEVRRSFGGGGGAEEVSRWRCRGVIEAWWRGGGGVVEVMEMEEAVEVER